MARPLKWRAHIYQIAASVRNAKTETWDRKDIQHVFNVGRVSSQTLMKAIGDIDDIGGKHVVSRTSLLAYLSSLIEADDLGQVHRTRVVEAEPVPRPRYLKAIPEDMRSIMVRDLPPEITLEPGRIEIRGSDAVSLMERLCLLAQAMENDLDSATFKLNPPPPNHEQLDDDLRQMFAELREMEAAKRRESAA